MPILDAKPKNTATAIKENKSSEEELLRKKIEANLRLEKERKAKEAEEARKAALVTKQNAKKRRKKKKKKPSINLNLNSF